MPCHAGCQGNIQELLIQCARERLASCQGTWDSGSAPTPSPGESLLSASGPGCIYGGHRAGRIPYTPGTSELGGPCMRSPGRRTGGLREQRTQHSTGVLRPSRAKDDLVRPQQDECQRGLGEPGGSGRDIILDLSHGLFSLFSAPSAPRPGTWVLEPLPRAHHGTGCLEGRK